MRHKTATALIGAGAFALAFAGLIPAIITPSLLKAPGEVDLVTHSRSSAQLLNSVTGELEPVTVDLTRKLTTHVEFNKTLAGNGSTAVFDELLSLAKVGPDGTPQTVNAKGEYIGIRAGESVVAFDRKSGQGVAGFQGDTWKTSGQTVKFPFNAEKKTYDYYDQTSRKAWPVNYKGTTKVQGLEVYEYFGTIPETSLGQYGVLADTDTLYSNQGRTVLVEPVTGSIVSSTTAPQTSIKFADGSVKQALLVESLVPTQETVTDRVADAKSSKTKALALQRAPFVLGLLGLLGLGFGLRGRRSQDQEPTGSTPRPDVSDQLPTPRSQQASSPVKARHQ